MASTSRFGRNYPMSTPYARPGVVVALSDEVRSTTACLHSQLTARLAGG